MSSSLKTTKKKASGVRGVLFRRGNRNSHQLLSAFSVAGTFPRKWAVGALAQFSMTSSRS